MLEIAREKYTTHEMRTQILSLFARYPRCYAMNGIAIFCYCWVSGGTNRGKKYAGKGHRTLDMGKLLRGSIEELP